MIINTKKIIILITINCSLLIANSALLAQGGSNYSIFGIGDIIYGQSASSQAMGGTQIAVPSNNTINMLNPALWSKVNTTRVQTGYRFNQNIISSNEATILQNNGSISGFYSIFNFDANREISAALLYEPVSSVNYYMSSPISINEDGVDLYGNKIYRGQGGLSNLTLGLGSKIIEGVYLGGSISASIGKIDHSILTNISNSNVQNYQYNNTSIFSGFNFTLGVFANPVSTLGIGVFYKHQNDASVEMRNEYIYTPFSSFLRDTAIVNDVALKMPGFWGAGLSYTIGRVLLSCDYLSGNFADFELNKAGSEERFANMNKISLGTIILGNSNQFATLIDRTSYKFGAYYEQLYYKVNAEQIIEYAITAGLQFPVSRTAQIDFSLSFGSRGHSGNGLIQEAFGRLIIDVSIGDSWFKPAKQEY